MSHVSGVFEVYKYFGSLGKSHYTSSKPAWAGSVGMRPLFGGVVLGEQLSTREISVHETNACSQGGFLLKADLCWPLWLGFTFKTPVGRLKLKQQAVANVGQQ